MSHWLEKVIALLEAETSDLRELARLAGGNPKTFYRGVDLNNLDTTGQDLEGMEFSEPFGPATSAVRKQKLIYNTVGDLARPVEVVQKVLRVRKQEERMAILLDLLLRNPADAPFLLTLYSKDKAKYANRVLKQLEIEVRASASVGDMFGAVPNYSRLSALQLARIVNRPFSRGMPNNRAFLLYFMAKHLARYPDINKYLRTKLERSPSIFLDPMRGEIRKLLDRGVSQHE